MNNLSEILERVKGLRVKKGISQTEMAELIGGITQAGYANIESNDKGKLSLRVAIGIAKALNVGFNELFDIDGDSQKIDNLNNEIETLKKRIVELEEQLNDKRQIIEFFTNSDLAAGIARSIRDKEEGPTPTNLDPDNLDLDALIKEVGEREEFDKNSKEYVLNVIKKLKRS